MPAGVLTTWAVLLIIDHRRYRNQFVSMGYGNMDSATGALIVAELRSRNIDASYFEEVDEDDDVETHIYKGIRCRNADAELVRGVIEEHLH